MPKFVVTNKKTGKEEIFKLDQDSIVIGRLNTNDIELAGKSVSRKHSEIVKVDDDFFLVDLESGNGTFLNGRKLKPNEKTLLRSNDNIQIEDFEIKFILIDETAPPAIEENTDSDIIEVKMIKKVLSALNVEDHPSLEVISVPCEGRKAHFIEDMQELVMGRDSSCQLVIDSPTMSRRHAALYKKWGGVTITDLGSKNGVLVNNQKVQEKLLKDGDVIMLGTIKVLFRNPQEINIEALSREYEQDDTLSSEEGEKPAAQKEEGAKKEEAVSEQAKISVAPESEKEKTKELKKPSERKKEIEKKPPSEKGKEEKKPAKEAASQKPAPPKEAPKPALLKFLKRFSTTELIMMGVGGVIFLVALIALISILL